MEIGFSALIKISSWLAKRLCLINSLESEFDTAGNVSLNHLAATFAVSL